MRNTSKIMTTLLAAALGLAAATPIGAHAADASALAFMREVYSHFDREGGGEIAFNTVRGSRRYFTAEIARLLRKDSNGGTAIGNLDFNPFICAQDWGPTPVALEVGAAGAPDKAEVAATFALGGTGKATASYSLVKTNAGWRIADIRWGGDCLSRGETLRGILKRK